MILKKYSEDNKIDLILDSNNYILSSNSINITDLIKDQVNKKKIEINFEKY
jgi:Skp family chaperone for outer membrane proteins